MSHLPLDPTVNNTVMVFDIFERLGSQFTIVSRNALIYLLAVL